MHWINQCQGRARLTKDRDVGYAYSQGQEKRGHLSEEYTYSKKKSHNKDQFSKGFTILKIAFKSLLKTYNLHQVKMDLK